MQFIKRNVVNSNSDYIVFVCSPLQHSSIGILVELWYFCHSIGFFFNTLTGQWLLWKNQEKSRTKRKKEKKKKNVLTSVRAFYSTFCSYLCRNVLRRRNWLHAIGTLIKKRILLHNMNNFNKEDLLIFFFRKYIFHLSPHHGIKQSWWWSFSFYIGIRRWRSSWWVMKEMKPKTKRIFLTGSRQNETLSWGRKWN